MYNIKSGSSSDTLNCYENVTVHALTGNRQSGHFYSLCGTQQNMGGGAWNARNEGAEKTWIVSGHSRW